MITKAPQINLTVKILFSPWTSVLVNVVGGTLYIDAGVGDKQSSSSSGSSIWSSILGGDGSGGNDELASALNATAAKIESISTPVWKALGSDAENMQGATTCYPANGAEVVAAVQGPDCTVIMLTKNYFDPYEIKTTLVVSSRKIIMGNPLTLPALKPIKLERLFHGE